MSGQPQADAAHVDARVWLTVGEVVHVDTVSNRALVVAAGTNGAAMGPNGLFGPVGVLVQVDLPRRYGGEQVPVSLDVWDATAGAPLTATDPSGQSQALRVQQLMQVPPATLPAGFAMPADFPCRLQLALNFAPGLALEPGHRYLFRVQIGGYDVAEAPYFALAPAPGPMFGGPAASGDPTSLPPFDA